MRKKSCLVLMNLLYYLTIALLILVLIMPHTRILYKWDFFAPFIERANTKTIYLTSGERYQINIFGVNKRATYTTTDFKVADVNCVGLITANYAGKSIVTIKRGKTVNRYRVYVLKMNRSQLTIRKSSSKKLKIEGKKTWVRWKSTDRRVASVNRFGKVKGNKKGSACIIARVKGKELKCKVYVK